MDQSTPSERIETLDCRGLVCPAPILEIAEVVRRQGADLGSLVVLATDLDFPEDVEAWCRSTGATLSRLDHQADGTIRAEIRLKHAAAPASISVAPTAILNPCPARRRSSVASGTEPTARRASTAWAERSPRMISHGPPVVASDVRDAFHGATALALRPITERPVPVPVIAQLPRLADDSYPPSLPRNVHTLVSRRPEAMNDLAAQEARANGTALPRENRAALLVLHNDLEALLAALTIANASAAQGMKVEVYFSFWGIHLLRAERRAKRAAGERPSLLQRLLLWLIPRGTRQPLGKLHLGGLGTRLLLRLMRKRNMLALEQLMHAAGSLGVRFRVCSASMDLMGLREEDILDGPNVDFVGAASFAEAAGRSAINLVF